MAARARRTAATRRPRGPGQLGPADRGELVQQVEQLLAPADEVARGRRGRAGRDRAGGGWEVHRGRGGHGRYGLARAGRYDLYDVFDPESAGRAGLRALQHAAGARPGHGHRPDRGDEPDPGDRAGRGPGDGGGTAAARGHRRAGPDRGLEADRPRPVRRGQGRPGSSRAHAAAVQPPGYGLNAGDPEPLPPPAPVEDPRVARRVALVGALLVAAVLLAGGVLLWLTRPAYLDSAAVQRQIADQLTGRLGGSGRRQLPQRPAAANGSDVPVHRDRQCRGRRAVTVTVVDNSGKYTWTLGTA